MSFNLINSIQIQLNDQVMRQLDKVLAGNIKQNQAAMKSSISGILHMLTKVSSSKKEADSMFHAINDQDDSILDNLSDFISSNKQSSIINQGTEALGSLLGEKGIEDLVISVANFNGTNKIKTGSLIGLLTPIIFSVVKREFLYGRGGGFDTSSLINIFKSQKENCLLNMPKGFLGTLELSVEEVNDFSKQDKESNVSGKLINDIKESKYTRTLPLIIILALVFLVYQLCFNDKYMDTINPKVISQVQGLDAIGVGNELRNTLTKLNTSLASITDVNSAKAALPDLNSANHKLGGLALMMNKFPDVVKAPLKSDVYYSLPQLQKLINKTQEINGVNSIIKNEIKALTKKLALYE